MRIMLTGSGGFIGRNLKECLEGRYELFAPRSRELDLLDENDVRSYLEEKKIDIVIHSAKMDVVYRKEAADYEVLDNNLRMFFNLVKNDDLYEKLFYFGSGAEYDKRSSISMAKEEMLGSTMPRDPYGFAKYVMNQYASRSEKAYELCLFGVYGKYEDYTRRFISNNICRILNGQGMSMRQNARFDYLYVPDLAKIMAWFIENEPKHHVYNVCSGKPVELMELAQHISAITGSPLPVPASEGYQPDYTGDNSRLMEEMGDFAFTPHEQAIAELYAYYDAIKTELTT